jgi:5'(3')-deoxyribonucleotidase
MKKKRLYIDMDGVLCDFKTPFIKAIGENPGQRYPHSQYGFFLALEPIKDAIESFKKLEEYFDVWILTRPSIQNPLCYTEKAIWVREKLGLETQRKTVMACDKSLLKGDFLVDDTTEYGQTEFEGEFIHFDTEKFPDWKTVVEYLIQKS